MAKQTRGFKRGDIVKWVSTSGGHTTVKTGTIVKPVSPGTTVLEFYRPSGLNPQLRIRDGKYNLSKLGIGCCGDGRTAKSYLVEVCNGEGRKPFLYFPETSGLAKA